MGCEMDEPLTGKSAAWNAGSGVGVTALLVASCRAIEGSKVAPLVVDPYAARFVAAAGTALPTTIEGVVADPDSAPTWLDLTDFVAVRTRVFDQFLTLPGVSQAVVLAAGLDSRAFRLKWPAGFGYYEVDRPAVLDFKTSVLRELGARPACRHHVLHGDLRADWRTQLLDAGFSTSAPSVWLVEGVTPYLDSETVRGMLHEIRELSAPGSRVAVETVPDLRRALSETVMATTGRTIGVDIPALVTINEPSADPATLLAGLGWRVRSVDAHQAALELGRQACENSVLRYTVYVFGELA
jgi:methyltransferase (TIGR00027 family)